LSRAVAQVVNENSKARIVCLPSFYGEGIPKSLLEAAAAGCAMVTTDAAGCREAVLPSVNSDLVPARDAQALVEALQRLIDDPQRGLATGETGRAMVCERFDIDSQSTERWRSTANWHHWSGLELAQCRQGCCWTRAGR
jgi:glycosyltransferase involved in cell wall biosynthesis